MTVTISSNAATIGMYRNSNDVVISSSTYRFWTLTPVCMVCGKSYRRRSQRGPIRTLRRHLIAVHGAHFDDPEARS